jgi:hypothetical protein
MIADEPDDSIAEPIPSLESSQPAILPRRNPVRSRRHPTFLKDNYVMMIDNVHEGEEEEERATSGL